MATVAIEITFTEEVLGSSPNTKEIYSEFIASKAPDAASVADEVEAVGADEVTEKGTTVFPRNDDGEPVIWDYQLKGFMKEIGIDLVDFKLEFGRLSDGTIVLADEISPDTSRLWDVKTHEKLDKDRFRRDLGGVEEAYAEIMRRLEEHLK